MNEEQYDRHLESFESATGKFPELYDSLCESFPEFQSFENIRLQWKLSRSFLEKCRSNKTKEPRLWIGEVKHDIESPAEGLYTTYVHKGTILLAGLYMNFSFKLDPAKNILGNHINIHRAVYDKAVKDWAQTLRSRDKAIENGWKGVKEVWGHHNSPSSNRT